MKAKNINFNPAQVDQLIKQQFPFDEFNAGQFESIQFAVNQLLLGKKHVVVEAPTGVGKSVIATTIHRVMAKLAFLSTLDNWRTTITTTTKGLQDQYVSDGWVDGDLRSKTNYKCPLGLTFGSNECAMARKQRMCNPSRDCEYLIVRQKWMYQDKIRTTNNSMLIEMPADMCANYDTKSDLIVIDECHKFDKSLINSAKISFRPSLMNNLIKMNVPNAKEIRDLIEKASLMFLRVREGDIYTMTQDMINIQEEILELSVAPSEVIEKWMEDYTDQLDLDNMNKVQQLASNLWTVKGTAELICQRTLTDTIVYEIDNNQVVLKPIFPRDVSEAFVFCKADQFVHMSATICGMDAYCERLGIRQDEVAIYNINNPIPVDNRLINYIPKVRMSGAASEEKAREITKHIDDIYENMHMNENALIHTVSYTLADMIMKYSKFRDRMFIGRNKDRVEVMKKLKYGAESGRGVICLSAAMEEGWDLKGDLCRMNVVAKVPYEFMGDPLVKFVSAREPAQYFREAILRIVQASGRCSRGVTDYGSTYILDESFGSLVSRNQAFFPQWYIDSIRAY